MPDINIMLSRYCDILISKRYSYSTITTYKCCIAQFLNYNSNKEILKIDYSDIENFINYQIINKKISSSTQNLYNSAIKLFYDQILDINNKSILNNINNTSVVNKTSINTCVFTKDEIKSILNVTKNIKHRVMLSILYVVEYTLVK